MEATHHPTLSEVKQWLCYNGYEETVVFENPDYAGEKTPVVMFRVEGCFFKA